MPFVSRTRATFRSAEFGFFGVTVKTRVQTPRFWGAPRRAGVFIFAFGVARPLRINWLTVGTVGSRSLLYAQKKADRGGGPLSAEPVDGSKAASAGGGWQKADLSIRVRLVPLRTT